MSQCPHCRGLRKARASHVACECGAKPHSKEDHDSESKSDHSEGHSDTTSDTGSAEQHPCCCSHGMRCTCALKKEQHLDPVPEVELPPAPLRRNTSSRKPRLLKADSETSLTVFTNGHHKPVHKHNDSAHKCGVPYIIPIPHSVHGNSDVTRHKSTDSLPLIKRKDEISMMSPQQEIRLVRSAHGSPEPRTSRYRGNSGPLPPLDFSYPTLDDNAGDYFHSPRLDGYYADEAPLDSAGLAGPAIDWSAMDLPLENGAFTTAYSQPPSYTSFDFSNVGQPGGVITPCSSDAGDYISHNTSKFYRPDLVTSTSAEERKFNRLSSSSFTSIPQTSVLSSSNLSDHEYETYLHRATASPIEFEDRSPGMPLSCEAFTRHGFTVHDAQKLAHPETPTEAMNGLSLPTPDRDLDAVWSGSFDSKTAPFVSQGQVENDWSR